MDTTTEPVAGHGCVPGTRTCCDCGAGFAPHPGRGKQSVRCEACRVSHKQAMERVRTKRRHADPVRYAQKLARNRTYWPKVKERHKEWMRAYRERFTPEQWREMCRRWRSTPAGRRAAEEGNRRRLALKRGVTHERYTTTEIAERDGWCCGICHRRISKHRAHPHPESASIDHIVPLSLGGDDTRRNVQVAHLACNVRKSNRGTGDQMRLIG